MFKYFMLNVKSEYFFTHRKAENNLCVRIFCIVQKILIKNIEYANSDAMSWRNTESGKNFDLFEQNFFTKMLQNVMKVLHKDF